MVITASCVLYNPNMDMLRKTLNSLDLAMNKASHGSKNVIPSSLHIINNSETYLSDYYDEEQLSNWEVIEHSHHGNIGYGAGHNLAIRNVTSEYHLIINPDVILDEGALVKAINFLEENPRVVLLSPYSSDPVSGREQYLCKKFPSVAVLALRFINLSVLNKIFETMLARYEERSYVMANKCFNADIVSGCFMLFRTEALKQLEGFDERYFLYFEDFDLSIRAKALGKVVCHPRVRIRHFGGGAGRKGWAHVNLFVRSAKLFFDQYGWRWF